MKTNTVITYTATELKEQFPDAFASALERHRNSGDPIPWQEEIFESLKACVERAGLKLRDWNLGLCNRSNGIKVEFPQEGAEELSGKRAMAWLENNLLGELRISFTARDRWKLAKYNQGMSERYYIAGRVPPCPLTGYCADENYLEALTDAVRKGYTLKEAFLGLADTYVEILEVEYENWQSEEYFIEGCEANDVQFTEDGELF